MFGGETLGKYVRESKLRCLGYVRRREAGYIANRVLRIEVSGKRERGGNGRGGMIEGWVCEGDGG